MFLRPAARAAHSVVVVALVVGGVAFVERSAGPHPSEPGQPVRAVPARDTTVATGTMDAAAAKAFAAGPRHRVAYHGISVEAPSAWPVVDLDQNPTACLRMDRPAVYIGRPGSEQQCPARLLGGADTIWLGPTTAADRAATATAAPRAKAAGGPLVRGRWDAASGTWVSVIAGTDVSVRATSASGSDPTAALVASIAVTGASSAPTKAATPSDPSTATASTGPAAYVQDLETAAPTGRSLTGMWFDTCAAPSASTMSTWKSSSPYAAVGVYIGGPLRGCGQPNLTSSWVSTVTQQGWGIVPIYVGYQAPCVQAPLTTFTASNAASVGTTSAVDAASKARALGLAAGSTIQYDLENYATGNASCSAAVLTMVSAWTSEIRKQGFAAGVYGNVGSLMTDMSSAIRAGSASFTAPDQVWYAVWNGLQTTKTGSSSFPDAYWAGQRFHQYRGDFTETWGGVSMQIDASWSTAPVPGNPKQVDYGSGVIGPGSAGFTFTGPMQSWRPSPGVGAMGRSYWTGSAGSTEVNGAMWSPVLSANRYAVSVNIPSGFTGSTATYVVIDADGLHRISASQTAAGWLPLGAFRATSATGITVHVGDNVGTGSRLLVDAARFTTLASIPGAPTGVTVTAGDTLATAAWHAAAANGSPVTAYTVTASPGGRSVTVGPTTSATVSGLTDGVSYQFSVTATNGVGTGAPSALSAPVIPTPPDLSFPRDVTGDGRGDLVAVVGSTGALRTYPGDGAGSWQPTRAAAASGWAGYRMVLTAGNWDADRVSDVLVETATGDLYLRHGNGDGTFGAPQHIGAGWLTMNSIRAVGDFDGDRHPDLIARRASDGALFLYSGNGSGGFKGWTQIGNGWSGFTAILGAGDFDGLGSPDVLARAGNGTLWLYPGNGAGGWRKPRQVGIGWEGFTALVAPGDFDGDGRADVLGRTADGSLLLYRGNGSGGWLGAGQIGSGWQIFSTILP